MKKTYIVHTPFIGGHQLEYLHHLYVGATLRNESKFVFVVPKRFESDSKNLNWPQSDNIVIDVMDDSDVAPVTSSILKKGWINSRTIRKYCKKYNATDVLTIAIMDYMPYLPLFVRNVRFCGIVYRIYLYEWEQESFLMRMQDVIKYLIMSRFKVFHRIFICNDSSAAQYLNKLYGTDKFRMMPDPVASLQGYQGKNLRKELGICEGNNVLLHIGGMNAYKNTIPILKALCSIDDDRQCKNLTVIFAGQIGKEIKKEFELLYCETSKRIQMFLFEGYLPFEKMADLFVTCNYVLVPYKVKGQSSGIIGHAAYYGKPVVALEGGLIGKIVRKWHLGTLLNRSSSDSIFIFISNVNNVPVKDTKGNGYSESHSVNMFNKTLIDNKDD